MTPPALLSLFIAYFPPRDPPGFRQFLRERNPLEPGETTSTVPPAVFWSILTAIFLANIATATWALLRRRRRRRSETAGPDFKSYK